MSTYREKVSPKQYFLRGSAVIGLVLAIGSSIWWAQSTKSGKQQVESKRDDRTQCLLQVSGAITVLVDRTDALTDTQLESLRSVFASIKKGIRKDERLAAYAIDAEPSATPSTLIEVCAPVSEQDASALTDNIKRVKKRFDETFGKPLDDFIVTLKSQKTENQSPILELIQSVSASAPVINKSVGEPRRELVVFSDMLQHSRRASLYKLQGSVNVQQLLDKAEIKDLISQTNFKAYEVKVYMIERCGYAEQQRIARAFWEKAFVQTGAISTTFLPMPTPQKACVGKTTYIEPPPSPVVQAPRASAAPQAGKQVAVAPAPPVRAPAPAPVIQPQPRPMPPVVVATPSPMPAPAPPPPAQPQIAAPVTAIPQSIPVAPTQKLNAREECRSRPGKGFLNDNDCTFRKCQKDPNHTGTDFCKDLLGRSGSQSGSN